MRKFILKQPSEMRPIDYLRRFGLFRLLFTRADKLYPKSWWCPSCKEQHYLKSVAMQQNWKVP